MQSQRSAIDVAVCHGSVSSGLDRTRVSRPAALPAQQWHTVSATRVAPRPERPPALGTRSVRKPRSGAAWLALTLCVAVSATSAQTTTEIIDATGDGTNSFGFPLAIAVDGSENVYVTGRRL